MNIYGKIVTAMVAFETLTGKRPGLIFAGEDEVAELIAWAAGPPGFSSPEEPPPKPRSAINGLTIIEVKDKSFLSVGIKT